MMTAAPPRALDPSPQTEGPASLVCLIPVYNDWEALVRLIGDLDRSAADLERRFHVLIVDDGSDGDGPPPGLSAPRESIASIEMLSLRRNLGHQRAIAVGLAWLAANRSHAAVVIMDGDGEDAPSDVPRLVACFEETGRSRIVFAARQRRSEGFVFQAFYHLYRFVHLVLTGVPVRVGNFSLVPWRLLGRLVVVSDLWNHYAAAVFKARLPMVAIPTERAPRLAGRPKLNFTALVVHGLSAISVFGDRVGVRLLIAAGVLLAMTLALFFALVGTTLLGPAEVSAGLLAGAGLLLLLALQLIIGVTLFAFGVLGSRDNASFLPARDHGYFVERHASLWARDGD